MKCPECGSREVYFRGWNDGGGDYGENLIEVLKCEDCGAIVYGDDYGIDGVIENFVDDVESQAEANLLQFLDENPDISVDFSGN